MSSQHQAVIAEAVMALNRASKRKSFDSDSDSSIEHATNRGFKLKKRARFVQQGRLAGPAGPALYKEIAELSGFRRAIISKNPPLIDDDGYDLDSEDEDERVQEAVAEVAEENPYSTVHLEQILAPLTAITDLPTHPTLSRPFTSKALTELASQGSALTQKEKAALWKVKPLLTHLCGDHTWAPCDLMTSANDAELFSDEYSTRVPALRSRALTRTGSTTPVVNGASSKKRNGYTGNGEADGLPASTVPQEQDAQATKSNSTKPTINGLEQSHPDTTAAKSADNGALDGEENGLAVASGDARPQVNGGTVSDGEAKQADEQAKDGDVKAEQGSTKDGEQHDGDRAKGIKDIMMRDVDVVNISISESARAGSPPLSPRLDPPPPEDDEIFIHPLFLAPRSARPDRNLALPEQEAEDVRRLVQLYVQKQEEVCRGTTRLYEGLLRADRLRRTVLRWAKAEAHCGANRDMSDGEDWYDKEDWGLTEDLKKGQDEEEEDAAQTQKKTRNRR